jgi:hypothetical protein
MSNKTAPERRTPREEKERIIPMKCGFDIIPVNQERGFQHLFL